MLQKVAMLVLGLTLGAAVLVAPAPLSAWSIDGCPGDWRSMDAWLYCEQPYGTLAVMEAYPGEAQFTLDGRPLGTSREVLAHGLTVRPGWHVIKMSAPGFRDYATRVWVDASGYATLFRARLVRN